MYHGNFDGSIDFLYDAQVICAVAQIGAGGLGKVFREAP